MNDAALIAATRRLRTAHVAFEAAHTALHEASETYPREYVEEAWVVLEGEHGDDLESAIRWNVAQAGGWAS